MGSLSLHTMPPNPLITRQNLLTMPLNLPTKNPSQFTMPLNLPTKNPSQPTMPLNLLTKNLNQLTMLQSPHHTLSMVSSLSFINLNPLIMNLPNTYMLLFMFINPFIILSTIDLIRPNAQDLNLWISSAHFAKF